MIASPRYRVYFFPVMMEGWVRLEPGKSRAAVADVRKVVNMSVPPFVTAYLANALGTSGDRAGAMRELADPDSWPHIA